MSFYREWQQRPSARELRYAVLTEELLRVGVTYDDDPHQDNAGEISLQRFVAGEYHEVLRQNFGEALLAEALQLARQQLAR